MGKQKAGGGGEWEKGKREEGEERGGGRLSRVSRLSTQPSSTETAVADGPPR